MNHRKFGPGDGPFPIPSILGEPGGGNQDISPGSLHTDHALNIMQSEEGVSDLVDYVTRRLEDLPQQIVASKNSEEEWSQLHQTTLEIQQALRIIQD